MFEFFKKNKNTKKIVNKPEINLPIDPLTVTELDEAIHKRMSLIQGEFTAGFDFIKQHPKSVTFFGGARFDESNPFYQKAVDLAFLLAKEKYTVVTGGGPGIMEAGNKGAYKAGGHSLGLTIELPHEQVTNQYVTDHVGFNYFFIRKVCLTFSAEAFVYFPGGFGTLDEFFEIMTLVQTKKIPRVPIILVGLDYWKPLLEFLKNKLLDDHKTISPEDLNLCIVMDNLEDIVALIKENPVRIG